MILILMYFSKKLQINYINISVYIINHNRLTQCLLELYLSNSTSWNCATDYVN